MKKLYLRFIMIFMALLLMASDVFPQTPILYIGRDAIGTFASDQFLFDSLTAWGYAPEYMGSGQYATEAATLDYNLYDGIFISETVNSSDLNPFGTSAGYPLPCVNMEGYTPRQDRWNWLEDNATQFYQVPDVAGTEDQLIIVIEDNTHYITEVFEQGDEIPWSLVSEAADIAATRPVSIMEANVEFTSKLAQIESHADVNSDFWHLVAIDGISPGFNKMVLWGVTHQGLNGTSQLLNVASPEFFVIVRRAADWAFKDAQSSVSVQSLSERNYKLEAYPNPASTEMTIKFRSERFTPVTATLFSITGQQVDMIRKDAVQGNNFIHLNAEKYSSGLYHIRLDIDGETAYTRIVIR